MTGLGMSGTIIAYRCIIGLKFYVVEQILRPAVGAISLQGSYFGMML
jgi:hypothetical protein